MHYANGDVYKGEWANDVPHGMGTLRLAPAARVGCIDGEVYTGQFVNKMKEGKGKFVWSNGDMYEGERKGDVRHGEGVMTFGNGRSVVRQLYREGKLVSEWQVGL